MNRMHPPTPSYTSFIAVKKTTVCLTSTHALLHVVQDLAKDEWLVGQAKAQAASIGRPDLLGPLATLSLASADSGISSGSSGRGGDVGLQVRHMGVSWGYIKGSSYLPRSLWEGEAVVVMCACVSQGRAL